MTDTETTALKKLITYSYATPCQTGPHGEVPGSFRRQKQPGGKHGSLRMPLVAPNLNGQSLGPTVAGLSFSAHLLVWAIDHLSLKPQFFHL